MLRMTNRVLCVLLPLCLARVRLQLLGLVKQFEVCGDGNAFVILKDPSGSIGATIHGDALKVESGIRVGSTLVLEKVSLFSADGRTQVLCITLDNLLQIF